MCKKWEVSRKVFGFVLLPPAVGWAFAQTGGGGGGKGGVLSVPQIGLSCHFSPYEPEQKSRIFDHFSTPPPPAPI